MTDKRFYLGGMTYDEAVSRFEDLAQSKLTGAALRQFAQRTFFEIEEGDAFFADGWFYTICSAPCESDRDDIWSILCEHEDLLRNEAPFV